MRKFLLFILLLGSISFPQNSIKTKIMVHYMPWYQTPSGHGAWGWHWTMNHFNPNRVFPNGNREIASQYYPLTGPYDSSDKMILEYQTLLMKISGIDGVLVDWYGMDNYLDYGTINESTQKLFSAVEKANLSFAIVYEDQTVKNMVNGGYVSSANALTYGKSVLKYMQNTWFNKSAYLKLDNRPVLLTFGPQYFTRSSDWITMFSELNVSPAFFTLDNYLSPAAKGAYPWPPMGKSIGGILTQFALTSYLDQFYQKAASFPYLVTSAFPGFHDIYKEAGVGSSYGYLDSQNGLTFKTTLQKALDHNPDVLQIVTWNDYGEGTVVEPTTQFGNQYLEMIQAAKDSLDPSFQFQPADLQMPLRIYNLRLKYPTDTAVNSVLDRIYNFIISGDRNSSIVLMDSLSSVTGISRDDTHAPDKYFLDQNYPNPFNPTTNFEFRIANPDGSGQGFVLVTLKIYDVLGKEVATVVNQELPPGEYHFPFSISHLPAGRQGFPLSTGIYFYRLTAGAFTATKKMILLK